MSLLRNIRVVLYEPQDPVNIGGTVRVMKNMGLDDLVLVRPMRYDPDKLERIAHNTRDLAGRIRHVDELDPEGDVPDLDLGRRDVLLLVHGRTHRAAAIGAACVIRDPSVRKAGGSPQPPPAAPAPTVYASPLLRTAARGSHRAAPKSK